MIDAKDPHVEQTITACVGEIKQALKKLRQRLELGGDFHGTITAPLNIINPGGEPVHRDIRE